MDWPVNGFVFREKRAPAMMLSKNYRKAQSRKAQARLGERSAVSGGLKDRPQRIVNRRSRACVRPFRPLAFVYDSISGLKTWSVSFRAFSPTAETPRMIAGM